jgi:molybdate transport system ATP-binding protein
MAISVDIEKKMGDFTLKVSFEAENETFAILGASGCGKSMTLKCIAGIETPDKGRIVLDGKVLFDSAAHVNMPIKKRNVGYLFQDYALFPNMTVRQNIRCGIREKGKQAEAVAEEYMQRFYLSGLENLYPWQLSGGQKQRAAMARMLAAKPDIIMLDEPFSALDNYLKWQMEQEIMKVMEEFGKTILFVSHDRNEVYRLTDRIAVMEQGKLVDIQGKKELFDNPKSLAATLLTGCKNMTQLSQEKDGSYMALDWGIRIRCTTDLKDVKYAGIRAHYFEPVDKDEPENVFHCEIVRVIEDTFSMIILFRQTGNTQTTDWSLLRYELSKEEWQRIKDRELYLKLPQEQLIWLDR